MQNPCFQIRIEKNLSPQQTENLVGQIRNIFELNHIIVDKVEIKRGSTIIQFILTEAANIATTLSWATLGTAGFYILDKLAGELIKDAYQKAKKGFSSKSSTDKPRLEQIIMESKNNSDMLTEINKNLPPISGSSAGIGHKSDSEKDIMTNLLEMVKGYQSPFEVSFRQPLENNCDFVYWIKKEVVGNKIITTQAISFEEPHVISI